MFNHFATVVRRSALSSQTQRKEKCSKNLKMITTKLQKRTKNESSRQTNLKANIFRFDFACVSSSSCLAFFLFSSLLPSSLCVSLQRFARNLLNTDKIYCNTSFVDVKPKSIWIIRYISIFSMLQFFLLFAFDFTSPYHSLSFVACFSSECNTEYART